MAWGSRLTSPYPWSSSTPVSKLSSKRSAPPEFSWPSMKARPAPASKCALLNQVWRLVSETTACLRSTAFDYCAFFSQFVSEVPNGSAARARWDTTHPPPSPQTANQRWATSLPPHPLPQPPPQSAGGTLTWTVSHTSRSHSDARLETHLEATGQLKEAVGVNTSYWNVQKCIQYKSIDILSFFVMSDVTHNVAIITPVSYKHNVCNYQVEAVPQRPRSSNAAWSTPHLSRSFSSTSTEVSRPSIEKIFLQIQSYCDIALPFGALQLLSEQRPTLLLHK